MPMFIAGLILGYVLEKFFSMQINYCIDKVVATVKAVINH
jgi:hypothetical protein